MPGAQVALIFWSILLLYQVFAEITFINRYGEKRLYVPHVASAQLLQVEEMPYPENMLHPLFEILRILSVVVRFTAIAGVFITAIFYVTNKVIVMNILCAVLNLVVQVAMIVHETKPEVK